MTTGRKLAVICFIVIPALGSPHRASAFKQEDLDKAVTTRQCPFCDLVGAKLAGTDLSGGRLSGTRLSGANLSEVNLSGTNARNANMHHAQLLNANLSNADLSGANLADADLSGATLAHAKLFGADLSEAKMGGADLSGADLSGAYWIDGKKCGEGSIGECKKGSAEPEKRSSKGRGSRGGMQGLPGMQ